MTTAAPASSPLAPDWSRIDRDIICPLCGYNLRGLSEPRCPECGYCFDWHALLNPPSSHLFLFEHHPGLVTFLRTLGGTHWPVRFWTRLEPTHRPRLSRLIGYWMISNSLMLVAAACLVAPVLIEWGPIVPAQDWLRLIERTIRPTHLVAAAVIFAWPILTGVLLRVLFEASLGRARIRTVHVVRCAVYTGDDASWLALAVIVFQGWLPRGLFYVIPWTWTPALFVAVVLACITAARLGFACDRYLKLDHPFAVAAATQLLLFLLALEASIYVRP